MLHSMLFGRGCQSVNTRCAGKGNSKKSPWIKHNGIRNGVDSWQKCGQLCIHEPDCNGWYYYEKGPECFLFQDCLRDGYNATDPQYCMKTTLLKNINYCCFLCRDNIMGKRGCKGSTSTLFIAKK